MRLDYFAASFAIFSLLVVFGISLIGDVGNTYDVTMDQDLFSDSYNAINDTYEISQDMQGHADTQITETDTSESMYRGAFSASRLVWSSLGAFIEIIGAIASTLGVPAYFVTVAISVLTIMLVFSIVYLVLRLLQ